MAVNVETPREVYNADSIGLGDLAPGQQLAMPVKPERRVSQSEIRLQECMREDAEDFVSRASFLIFLIFLIGSMKKSSYFLSLGNIS